MISAIRLSLLLVLPLSLFSQTAELSGFIKDPQRAAVPNVSVELRNEETGSISRTKSNSDGGYVVPALTPGKYDLTAQATGFKTLTRDGIVLEVEQRARLDFTMELGSVEEKVTVTADAPLINSADASVSTVVDRQFVENMPLNGRSFQALITLTPGVVTTPTANGNDQGQFSVAGQRSGSNYFSIDGVSVNFGASIGLNLAQTSNGGIPAFSALGSTASLVSVDALQEFRLASSTYAPEFGRQSGAQVMLVTRSGTNSFHGTVFDYLRNDVLDASDWFANSTRQPKPRERQNDFGGVLGGPIKKDKTFFFFSYEGLRVAQPLFQIGDVPSLEARASAAPNVKPMIDAFALPNGPATSAGLSQFAASAPNHSTLDATSLRIDHSLNSKVTLFGRYNHSPSNVVQTFSGWATTNPRTLTQEVDTATLGSTAILTPAITNDFRFNYSRSHGADVCHLDNFGGATPPPASAVTAPWQNLDTDWVFMGIGSGRNTLLCVGRIANNLNHQLNITDSVEIVKGTHSLKFGFDFRRLTPVQIPSTSFGYYYWLTADSALKGAPPDDLEMIIDPSNIQQLYYNFSSFGQDTWKISNRMTLTYGVRWDYNPPPTEKNGNANAPYTLSQITNLATATLLPRGSPLWHADWKNFAPRVGISYQLGTSTRPTVLRAGFGQFYDLGTSTAGLLDNSEGWFPYSLDTVLCLFGSGPSCPGEFPYRGPKPPFVFTQPIQGTMRAFDPHLKLPYSLQWNVALEQALSRSQTFKVTYLGSAGRRLLRDDIVSYPNPILSSIWLTKNTGHSNYNALQLEFQRRLSHGLQALVSYSWSHSLDLNSSDAGFLNGTGIPTNLYNVKQDYGNSDFDIRHSFSAAITYNIPGLNIRHSFARTLLRNWSIDSINSARTGTPLDVLYTPQDPGAFTNDGYGNAFQLRPDQVFGQAVWISDPNAPGGKKLNPAAFTIPAVLRQGSEGRNTIRGFPLVEIDLALRRQFSLSEHVNLQLRPDAFNIINHPNFGPPNNNIGTCAKGVPCTPLYGFGISQAMLNQSLGSSNYYGNAFGSLYQVGGPRSLQVSVKLQF